MTELAAEPRPWQRILPSRAGEADDVVHGQEIAGVFHVRDDVEFVPDESSDLFGDASGSACGALPGQPLQLVLRVEAGSVGSSG